MSDRELLGAGLATGGRRRPDARALVARWEGRLAQAGLPANLAMIRRPAIGQVVDPESNLHQPGLLVRAHGVWRQTVDHSMALLTVDTRNTDGSRGRVRRHALYFERLRAAAGKASLTPRELVVVDVLVAGGTWEAVGKRLGRGKSRVYEMVRDLHRKLGIKGPGGGR